MPSKVGLYRSNGKHLKVRTGQTVTGFFVLKRSKILIGRCPYLLHRTVHRELIFNVGTYNFDNLVIDQKQPPF